jgi:PGF-pre-PGF domain-containing protein
VIPFTQNGLVSEVTVKGIKNYGEVTAVVSLLKKNPTNITIDNVYKFFSVNIETIKHENEQLFFTSPTVTVFLSKENINDKVVKVYRFINGSWVLVDIEELTGTDENRHFKLKLDKFSNFAVVLESKTTAWTAPARTSESNLPTMTQTGTEPKSDAPSNTSLSERILSAIKDFLMRIFGR